DGATIAEGVFQDRVAPLFLLARLIELNSLFAALVRQPHLCGRPHEVLFGPLPSIDGSDECHVPQRRAEQLDDIKGERLRGTARAVEEANGRLQSDADGGGQDVAVEQAVAEGERRVEWIAGRSPCAAAEGHNFL